jgi:2-amino-4-hydroxy-6-hydroxymethyldihydropteridine diphosphokinase
VGAPRGPAPVDAYIALGANIDAPRRHLEQALQELDAMPQSRLLKASSFYRSAPWGYQDQPDFVNAVARIETRLTPGALLAELLGIEHAHGRERSFKNAPRPLDLDIVLYGDQRIDEPGLAIPHPRMRERAFVLAPLAEIAPDLSVPGLGSVQALLALVRDQTLTKL